MTTTAPLVLRRLYRSLLQAAKPFTAPSPDAVVLNCLLHRSGSDDDPHVHRILDQIIPHDRHYQFPEHVHTGIVRKVLRHEFRSGEAGLSMGFRALRELHQKLAIRQAWNLSTSTPPASHVQPLPLQPPEAYLQPGAFLLAHPLLSGYFARTVVCMLSHSSEEGSYGLIVNRRDSDETHKPLQEVIRPLPDTLLRAFGQNPVHEGGPVHMSLQMLHRSERLGGHVLPWLDEPSNPPTIRYQGDIVKAAEAVLEGELEAKDVTFFVGASCWAPGQLAGEVDRGCWLPCRAPPKLALEGEDLWKSMMAACGKEEGQLADWVSGVDDESLLAPCDDY